MAARGVDYAPAEIDTALTVLAGYGGNSVRAGEQLSISPNTLRTWKSYTHRDRYLELAERERPKLEAIAANQAVEIMLKAADQEHNILDRMDDAETTKELSDLAGAFQRVATAKGINTTKLLELTGRPTQIVEHRDPKQAAAALARRLGVTLTDQDVIEVQNLALPTESTSANARDSSVSQPAD